MRWDPDQYLRFADERARPFHELLARVPASSPSVVADLGCGPATLTRELAERWPGARVEGVDYSAEMIERARAEANSRAASDKDRQKQLEEMKAKYEAMIQQYQAELKAKSETAKAAADVKAADAKRNVAKAEAARAKTMLEYRFIRAPFAGTVTRRKVDPGHFVQPVTGFQVASVHSMSLTCAMGPGFDLFRNGPGT